MHDLNLSDGVVVLSPLRLDDVDAHLAGEDELLVRWLSGEPATRAGTEAYFRHCIEQWATCGPLRALGIRTAAQRTLVGYIDLRFDVEGLEPGQVNISYVLYPAWRGQGLVSRAVRLICRYAAAEGATQGVIRVDPENYASAAVARRSGFTYDKQLLEADGNRTDWYLLSLPDEGGLPST
ncbi:GNAT family N-acetyltransferase [Streptomyces sp. NBC_01005]|uniref:GNAT family N-acetyltransferase n=1 Tax=unclassified Streptomyces TaxID=2593676 RepID=UPI002E310EA8|nr:GNAT family N-acetyltransferase [Streptomyces sp. NBC_01362]WSW09945.1 GNAT family N-acetyltransferase [Streptomyces sp. NBC_01005]WTC99454.1 GNAT family N-acetyltransferase [Streptomyces sp. NBC_01650]